MTSRTATAYDPHGAPLLLRPFERLGGFVIAVIAYLGELASLMLAALLSPLRRESVESEFGFWHVLRRELGWLLMTGTPLVGLVHIGMGSSLSMQAYFGSTFVDGTGAVVGVGLIRNVATLATGMTLAGLLALRIMTDRKSLSGISEDDRAPDRIDFLSRTAPGPVRSEFETLSPGKAVAPRIAAAAMAMMLLSIWGSIVGTVIGWRAATNLMGLSTNMYFLMFYRMIWYRDVIGLLLKGLISGMLTAAICCHEGMRANVRTSTADEAGGSRELTGDDASRILRAACVSIIALLLLNMAWFILFYHAVPSFGPSLLQPPTN